MSVFRRVSALWLFPLLLMLLGSPSVHAQSPLFKSLHSFNFADGALPYGNMMQGSDGALYGTTYVGGSAGLGTVFRVTLAGELTTLHSFHGADGTHPRSAVIQGSDGALYGTTADGGTTTTGGAGNGTLFRLTLAGDFTSLHTFDYPYGLYPQAGVIQGSDGALYGATYYGGGSANAGTVYRLTLAGDFTTLHTFNYTDGAYPSGGVMQSSDGALYGTTYGGGVGYGTVYRLTLAGDFTTLHTFHYTDGAYPEAGVIQGSDRALYGATSNSNGSGIIGVGSVFRLTLAGDLTTLHAFNNTDGAVPYAGVIQGSDGALYGTTYFTTYLGDHYGDGTVFRLTLAGDLTTLHTFNNTDGSNPFTGVIQASDGALYGATILGGSAGYGTLFSLSQPDTTPPVVTAAASNNALWPPNGKMVPVTITGKITDEIGGSGVDSGSGTYSTVDSYGQVQPAGSFTIQPDGSYSFTILLEARRSGRDKNGRTYTITVTAKDRAGNIGKKAVTVTVPHNQ